MPDSPSPAIASGASSRLMSVDALRGFDMFWIMGADSLVYALSKMSKNPVTGFLGDQLEHVDWAGFHFYDLIFPLFVFIAGVSLVFSLTKNIAKAGKGAALKRLCGRSVLLFIVALLYSGGFSSPWPDMRLLGVLNRIALCYFFAGLIFIYCKPKVMVGICIGLLAGYWAVMTFAPIHDIQLEKANLAKLALASGNDSLAKTVEGSGNPSTIKDSPVMAFARQTFDATTIRVSGKFEPGYNLANHIDFQYLPGKKWDNFYDPEGLLSTIPAIATCLLGVFAGLILQGGRWDDRQKLVWLFGAGVAGVALGFLWGLQFPVIKKLWTSSFVLVAGGFSTILLATFYLVVDVWKYQRWCQPFVWIGMNSITVYLVKNLVGGYTRQAGRFVGGDVKIFFDTHVAKGFGDLMLCVAGLLLMFWFMHFLYKRKIFLRL